VSFKVNDEQQELKAQLLGSLLLFTQVFYKIRTGREFEISEPIGRQSHHIIICRELTLVFDLKTNRLLINVPPGHGKSELMIHFIAWALAHYPDCQFLYISYSHELAAKHTYTIKQIIELPLYRKLFGVEIKRDSSAKDDFKTAQGGAVKAFGSSGGITGQDAGLPNLDRFSGAVVMDDMHKPDEVHSDTIREKVKLNYADTIEPRPRGPNVPILFIGQRLHEDDLPASFLNGDDGYDWRKVILKGLDDAGNALHPKVMPKEKLLILEKKRPYVFAAQQQQNPQPAGGGIFKEKWFIKLDESPNILATFLTVDTAETEKTHNDATVFSFWGIYKILLNNTETGEYALHWIDCAELWVEPKDLKNEFLQFYTDCLRYHVKPKIAGIEKKSTGTTLISVLKEQQGLQIIEIERNRGSGSKTARFLDAQPYAASQQITLPVYGKHTQHCIEHMGKITANESHRYDDIADTLADAVKLALIDKVIFQPPEQQDGVDNIVKQIAMRNQKLQQARERARWPR
jgi:predicted phage terminase large subunit-like protein